MTSRPRVGAGPRHDIGGGRLSALAVITLEISPAGGVFIGGQGELTPCYLLYRQ